MKEVRAIMKSYNFVKNIKKISLLLLLVLVPVAVHQSKKPPTSEHKVTAYKASDLARVEKAEVDIKQVQALFNQYEKELSQAKTTQNDVLAELSRLSFILGEWGKKEDQKKYFENGRDFAKSLSREQPQRIEGHYWLALNLGGLAAMRGDLRLVPAITEEMQIAAAIDERYDQAGPHRVLGRIYSKAPPWPVSVGDLKKSLWHLRKAVQLDPDNSTNHLFLAETLLDVGKSAQACKELKNTLSATHHANWASELEADHQKAHQLLQECKAEQANFPEH